MRTLGLAGYMVEHGNSQRYMTLQEFAALCGVCPPRLAYGLYRVPQPSCSGNIQVSYMNGRWLPASHCVLGAIPLWRGMPAYPPYTEEPAPQNVPVLVSNHLLYHRPDLCPECHGRNASYCQVCGRGAS